MRSCGGFAPHQFPNSFRRQELQRLPHRAATHAQRAAQFGFLKRRHRRQPIRKNVLSQIAIPTIFERGLVKFGLRCVRRVRNGTLLLRTIASKAYCRQQTETIVARRLFVDEEMRTGNGLSLKQPGSNHSARRHLLPRLGRTHGRSRPVP